MCEKCSTHRTRAVHSNVLSENLKESDHLQVLGVNDGVIF